MNLHIFSTTKLIATVFSTTKNPDNATLSRKKIEEPSYFIILFLIILDLNFNFTSQRIKTRCQENKQI